MMREVKNVRQNPEDGFRRWFVDAYFDLIVWYDKNGISGFQLCYEKNYSERSLTWRSNGGYSHNKVDQGEVAGGHKMSPILVADGIFAKESIAERFLRDSQSLEKELAAFIYEKIKCAYGV